MNIYEQRLRAVLSALQDYLPPDGVSAHDTLTTLIGLVDPWPTETGPIAGPSSGARSDKAILPAESSSAAPVEAVEVPDDLLDYMKGIYGFLESIAPAGTAIEAFRLPPSATRAQRAVFDAVSGDARGERVGLARKDMGNRPEDRGAVGTLVAQPPHAVQEDERDAKRYRWIRSKERFHLETETEDAIFASCFANAEEFDTAVDAAISATTKEN